MKRISLFFFFIIILQSSILNAQPYRARFDSLKVDYKIWIKSIERTPFFDLLNASNHIVTLGIEDSTIQGLDIDFGTINTNNIANNAITSGLIANGTILNEDITDPNITFSAGEGLYGSGGQINLGGSILFQVNVDNSTISIVNDTLEAIHTALDSTWLKTLWYDSLGMTISLYGLDRDTNPYNGGGIFVLVESDYPTMGGAVFDTPIPGFQWVSHDFLANKIVTPQLFGAITTDGTTTDDAPAIQKAINFLAATSDSGGNVFVPPGRYVFKSRVYSKHRVNLIGEEGTAFRGSTAVAGYQLESTIFEGHSDLNNALITIDSTSGFFWGSLLWQHNVLIRGITFKGGSMTSIATTYGGLITANCVIGFKIENCTFYDSPRHGIGINHSLGFGISGGSYMHNGSGSGITDGAGIYIQGGAGDGFIENGQFGLGDYGIYLAGGNYTTRIENNKFFNHNRGGLLVGGTSFSIIIVGNDFHDQHQNYHINLNGLTKGLVTGNMIWAGADTLMYVSSLRGVTISGNTFADAEYGIVDESSLSWENAISGNTFYNISGNAIEGIFSNHNNINGNIGADSRTDNYLTTYNTADSAFQLTQGNWEKIPLDTCNNRTDSLTMTGDSLKVNTPGLYEIQGQFTIVSDSTTTLEIAPFIGGAVQEEFMTAVYFPDSIQMNIPILAYDFIGDGEYVDFRIRDNTPGFDEVIFQETFNDYVRRNVPGIIALWVNDSLYHSDVQLDTIGSHDLDYSGTGSGNNLTKRISQLFQGGKKGDMDGTNYWSIASGSAGDFNPGTGDFSWWVWFDMPIPTSPEYRTLVQKKTGYTSATSGWAVYHRSTNDNVYWYIADDASHQVTSFKAYNQGALNLFLMAYDAAVTADHYVNGTKYSTGATALTGSVTNSNNLYLGADNSGATRFDSCLVVVGYSNQFLSQKDVNNIYSLADGWYSKGTGATRVIGTDAKCFRQGVTSDTIYAPLPDDDIGGYTLTFSDSAAGSVAYKAGIIKNHAFTNYGDFTSSAGINSRTVLIDEVLSGDSLAFVVPSGTVYFDDIMVTTDTTDVTVKKAVVGLKQMGLREPNYTYGSELITNGTFDSDLTGWENVDWSTFEWSSGTLHLVYGGSGYNAGGITDASRFSVTAGHIYKFKFNLTRNSGSSSLNIDFRFSLAGSAAKAWGKFTSGEYDFNYTATSTTTLNVYLYDNAAGNWTIDNVSVKEILNP